jgi:flagellar hook-length control protein FliK
MPYVAISISLNTPSALPAQGIVCADFSEGLPEQLAFKEIMTDLLLPVNPAAAEVTPAALSGKDLPPVETVLPLPVPAAPGQLPTVVNSGLLSLELPLEIKEIQATLNDPLDFLDRSNTAKPAAALPPGLAQAVVGSASDKPSLIQSAMQAWQESVGSVGENTQTKPTLAQAVSAKDVMPLPESSAPNASSTAVIATSESTAATGPAKPIETAPIPVRTPGFENELANRVTWMANQKVQTAEIAVHPADLGPIEVRIEIRNDQASVVFGAAHGETRAALEAALPKLRELMSGQGLNLADASVAEHRFARGEANGGSSNGSRPGGDQHGQGPDATLSLPATQGGVGLLDVYV